MLHDFTDIKELIRAIRNKGLQPRWLLDGWPYGSNNWDMYGLKVGREARFFSDLEYYNWVRTEANPDVEWYCEQPLKVSEKVKGEMVGTIFDLVTLYKNGEIEFSEVKYQEDVADAETQISAQEIWCEKNGFVHKVRTENEILDNEYIVDNWITILSDLTFFKGRSNPMHEEFVSKVLGQSELFTLGDLYQLSEEIGEGHLKAAVFNLIYTGKLMADLGSKTFNRHTRLSFNLNMSWD
jgi:hypothetical protein